MSLDVLSVCRIPIAPLRMMYRHKRSQEHIMKRGFAHSAKICKDTWLCSWTSLGLTEIALGTGPERWTSSSSRWNQVQTCPDSSDVIRRSRFKVLLHTFENCLSISLFVVFYCTGSIAYAKCWFGCCFDMLWQVRRSWSWCLHLRLLLRSSEEWVDSMARHRVNSRSSRVWKAAVTVTIHNHTTWTWT